MGLLERGGLLRNDKSWSGRARAADIARKCPRPPAPAEPLASSAKPKGKKKDEEKTWPNKGKYTPGKGKQRGR